MEEHSALQIPRPLASWRWNRLQLEAKRRCACEQLQNFSLRNTSTVPKHPSKQSDGDLLGMMYHMSRFFLQQSWKFSNIPRTWEKSLTNHPPTSASTNLCHCCLASIATPSRLPHTLQGWFLNKPNIVWAWDAVFSWVILSLTAGGLRHQLSALIVKPSA